MTTKRLTVLSILAIGLFLVFNVASLADELGDVQKKIREKGLKWVAEQLPNPERRGLGLLNDGFTGAVETAVTGEEDQAVVLPANLDWRNVGLDNLLGVAPGNYVTPVKNQGGCGSCWAFATTATAESTTHISLNDPISILDPNSDYDLSEQDMLNCSGGGTCNGGYVTTASTYLSTTGLLQEKPAGCYSYNYLSTVCPNPTSFPTCDQSRYKIDSWSGVSATAAAIKSALNSYGPLVVTFAVYNDFYKYYASGIYEAVSCDTSANPLVGYHAVSVVGYDESGTTPYFIVKNSWGTGWGEQGLWWNEKGYFRIGYSQVSNCVGFGGTTLAYSISSAQEFGASGSVTSGSGAGLSGVTMTFSRVSGAGSLPGAVLTNSDGNWSQTGFQQGTNYRVTPSKLGTTFSPTSFDFSGSSSGLNFIAIENKLTAVTSPAGGSWRRGTTLLIKWTYTGNPGSFVKIELMSGSTVKTTINSRAKIGSGGNGSLDWRIPSKQATGSYTIRVTSTTNGSSATSAVFTIN